MVLGSVKYPVKDSNLLLSGVWPKRRVEQVLAFLASVGTEGIVVAVLRLGIRQDHHLKLRFIVCAWGDDI